MELADISLRIGMALAAGSVVGLNRDLFGKPTGVRLHALVAIASATAVMCGIETDPTGPSRVIQGIVGGIGFLGAGVIMRGTSPASGASARAPGTSAEPPPQATNPPPQAGARPTQAPDIHYLATAASIWLTATLGIVAGLGLWRILVVALVSAVFVLLVGIPIDRALHGRFNDTKDHGPIE